MSARRNAKRIRERAENVEIANALGIYGKRAAAFGARAREHGATIEEARKVNQAKVDGTVKATLNELRKPPEPTLSFWLAVFAVLVLFVGTLVGLVWALA